MNEQLEDFPKRDELRSVFVEREIEDEEVGVQDDGFPIHLQRVLQAGDPGDLPEAWSS